MRVAYDGERMCIRTRCRNTEQLVCTLKHYVKGTSLFVSTLNIRPVGTESPFDVLLADGTVVMRGRSVIREAWSNADNPFHRPGILINIRALARSSKLVFDKIRGSLPALDPTSVPIPRSPHLQARDGRNVTAPLPAPTVTPAMPDDSEAAFVTDSGTLLGAGPRALRSPSPDSDDELDAFLAVLHAAQRPAGVDTVQRPRATTRGAVPVKVTIPPRGATGDYARPRIETAPFVSAATTVMNEALREAPALATTTGHEALREPEPSSIATGEPVSKPLVAAASSALEPVNSEALRAPPVSATRREPPSASTTVGSEASRESARSSIDITLALPEPALSAYASAVSKEPRGEAMASTTAVTVALTPSATVDRKDALLEPLPSARSDDKTLPDAAPSAKAATNEALPEATPDEVSEATTGPLHRAAQVPVPTEVSAPSAEPPIPKPLRKCARLRSTDSLRLEGPLWQPNTAPTAAMEWPPSQPNAASTVAMERLGEPPSPSHVLPANPLMALTDSALAGYVDCTFFDATDAATSEAPLREHLYSTPFEAPVPSLRPKHKAMWWTLVALVLGVGALAAFHMRTEAAVLVRKPDAVPARSTEPQPATFDLHVVPRPATAAEDQRNHMTFDFVVTQRCASEPIVTNY